MKKENLPDLNETVLAALDFFRENPLPRFDRREFSFPLVVGSGNAYNSGLVIFAEHPAIVASESNLEAALKNYRPLIKDGTIKQALLISASGEKDSVREIRLLKKAGLKTTLLTCNAESSAARIADRVLAYPKLPEPYTYNVSTYLGMIMSAENESAERIKEAISRLKLPKAFPNYSAYSFILPDRFAAIAPMLEIKRHELFGPHLSLRAFSAGEARHAKFINVWDKELVISLGKNGYFGNKKDRWEIDLPRGAKSGLVMALCYYLIGKIQGAKPPYFKDNIAKYCQEGPKAYGQKKPFDILVK